MPEGPTLHFNRFKDIQIPFDRQKIKAEVEKGNDGSLRDLRLASLDLPVRRFGMARVDLLGAWGRVESNSGVLTSKPVNATLNWTISNREWFWTPTFPVPIAPEIYLYQSSFRQDQTTVHDYACLINFEGASFLGFPDLYGYDQDAPEGTRKPWVVDSWIDCQQPDRIGILLLPYPESDLVSLKMAILTDGRLSKMHGTQDRQVFARTLNLKKGQRNVL